MKIKNILLGTVVGSLSMCGLVSCDNDFLEEKSYEYTSSTSYNTPEELDMAVGFLHVMEVGRLPIPGNGYSMPSVP